MTKMANQITKRLVCLWKDCDGVFENAAALQEHFTKHVQEQIQTDLDSQPNDGTEVEKGPLLANKEDKREIVFLAIEVWTDVFGFIKRIQLARTVSLTNRHVHRICWPRLHGNKVEVHYVRFFSILSRERMAPPPKALVMMDGKLMPLPSSPPPDYIFGFEKIIINFLDQKVLAFFTHISSCMAKNSTISVSFNEPDGRSMPSWTSY